MRSVATVFMWLVTTLLLAVTLPVLWAQQNLVDRSGYTALTQRAATNPDLQSAAAVELTTQVGRLSAGADAAVVGRIAKMYTAGPSFPGQFAQANDFAHRWLFTDGVGSALDAQGRWVIDFAPLLSDAAFAQTLRDYNIAVPTSIPIPLTDNAPAGLRPGSLRVIGMWAPWVAWGLVALCAASALLTLMAARNRGKSLVGLGVSAVLVGAAGWAAIELAQRPLLTALDNTAGNIRTIADVMVATAESSMHQWLNVTMTVGGGLVIVGVLVSLLAGLARHHSAR
ncbi:MAG: hypothetical protein QG655_403 [Actinomycetota bacterium]|nr:hypothetical protein [Actinomycetota bacterium]